ncbi:MAG: hypothetical protein EB023_14865 [Flavobacteriia bacterium]|nr:hypothetical protein [Flavobacteriia bacterium]
MEELTTRFLNDVKSFLDGEGDEKTLDRAIHTSYEITEKLLILRYKAYEGGLIKPSKVSLQEFDFDFSNESVRATDNILPSSSDSSEFVAVESQGPNESVLFDTTNTNISEPHLEVEQETKENFNGQPEGLEMEAPIFDLKPLIAKSKGKHEKIDTFNGNYSLKEKITFINVLFGGSSESFGTAVKLIDTFHNLEETLPTLHFLATTYRWHEADASTLSRFIEKIVAKYA